MKYLFLFLCFFFLFSVFTLHLLHVFLELFEVCLNVPHVSKQIHGWQQEGSTGSVCLFGGICGNEKSFIRISKLSVKEKSFTGHLKVTLLSGILYILTKHFSSHALMERLKNLIDLSRMTLFSFEKIFI